MTSLYIQYEDDAARCKCANCGEIYRHDQLDPISDLEQRIGAGGEVPAGQCPADDCGALCYLDKPDLPTVARDVIAQLREIQQSIAFTALPAVTRALVEKQALKLEEALK